MTRNPLDDFDYQVRCDDFLLYELGRLIEEDRVSLEDEEFRRAIAFGIHEHLERRLDVRADMAARRRLRFKRPDRILRAIEDIESPLRDIPEMIQSYASYLFRRLEQCAETAPDERLTAAADQLLESPQDRVAAAAALDLLGGARSAVSARILAHAVSEPMLDEDLEAKAYGYLLSMWPLARDYIVYSLKPHNHEDIPFRWLQLLIECGEPSAVERILEEIVVHANAAEHREDLLALTALLVKSADPETEDKVLQVLNADGTPEAGKEILERFLQTAAPAGRRETDPHSAWAELDRIYAANRRYIAAAKLFDSGRKTDALNALDQLLKDQPGYPFAVMLRKLAV